MATQNRTQERNNNKKNANAGVTSGRTTTTSPGGDFSAATEAEGFVNHPHFAIEQEKSERTSRSSFSGSDIMARISEFTGIDRAAVNRVVKHAEANPWLHIGAVGAAGLFLGYAFSRGISSGSRNSTSDFRETFDYDEYEDADVE